MFPDVVEGWLWNARCGNMWNIASRIQNNITINGDMAKLAAGGRQLLLTFFHRKSDVRVCVRSCVRVCVCTIGSTWLPVKVG